MTRMANGRLLVRTWHRPNVRATMAFDLSDIVQTSDTKAVVLPVQRPGNGLNDALVRSEWITTRYGSPRLRPCLADAWRANKADNLPVHLL